MAQPDGGNLRPMVHNMGHQPLRVLVAGTHVQQYNVGLQREDSLREGLAGGILSESADNRDLGKRLHCLQKGSCQLLVGADQDRGKALFRSCRQLVHA